MVADRPVRLTPRRVCQDSPEDVAAARKERTAANLRDDSTDLGLGSLDLAEGIDET